MNYADSLRRRKFFIKTRELETLARLAMILGLEEAFDNVSC
jgi:hypothetical protein